jgi:hypothetical protein
MDEMRMGRNPRRGGRQQPHQTLKKSKKYNGDAINPKDA